MRAKVTFKAIGVTVTYWGTNLKGLNMFVPQWLLHVRLWGSNMFANYSVSMRKALYQFLQHAFSPPAAARPNPAAQYVHFMKVGVAKDQLRRCITRITPPPRCRLAPGNPLGTKADRSLEHRKIWNHQAFFTFVSPNAWKETP